MNALVPISAAPALPALSMGEIEHIATTIARGGLFGSKDPYAVATLCMLAYAEGQHPVSVFRDYHVISGKPSKKAEAMQRDFLAAGGSIEWHQLDDECADATFKHPLGGSARITWDQPRVKKAQLGGNAMHTKYPRQMLRSRVVSEGVRTVFPGATSGLYVPEEVASFDDPKPMAQPVRARDLQAEKPAIVDNSGRARAEAWVVDQVQAVTDAPDHDALDAVIATGNKAVRKLAKDHADLHGQVQAAYEKRAAELDGYGKPDTDHGESHATDAEAITAQYAAADDPDTYEAAKKAHAVLSPSLSEDEHDAVQDAADEAAARCLS